MELEDKLNKAKEISNKTEDAMIAYDLSIAPNDIREILSRNIDTNYKLRYKIIDMVFRLDTSTVQQ